MVWSVLTTGLTCLSCSSDPISGEWWALPGDGVEVQFAANGDGSGRVTQSVTAEGVTIAVNFEAEWYSERSEVGDVYRVRMRCVNVDVPGLDVQLTCADLEFTDVYTMFCDLTYDDELVCTGDFPTVTFFRR